MRKTQFANGEFYHIYNRGVDKRTIFSDKEDLERFFLSMKAFNVSEPIGSIYEKTRNDLFGGSTSKIKEKTKNDKKLVNFISYCLNPNHYHFLLEQVSDNGIQKFMHRLGTGFTMYFNEKHKRTGALFGGRYKSILVDKNNYLLHVSAYVNLNFKVHGFGGSTSKSSWNEYTGSDPNSLCEKDVILKQFKNKKDYETFSKSSITETIRRRKENKEIDSMLLE